MWAALAARGEVAVVGLVRSGVAATRLLRQHGVPVYASDRGRSPALEATAESLRALGAAVELGGHDLGRIGRAGLLVVSPGVPPDAPAVRAARDAGREIWSEVELGLRAIGGGIPYVAVTGTNGKTTTTDLTAHVLREAGRRAVAAGNIGTPVSEIARGPERPDIMVIELSSFQLHDTPSVAPTVGVVTNLAPDHLDRYATVEEYYRDKMRLFDRAGPASIWVTNADDLTSRQWIGSPAGTRLRFSVRERADGWLDRPADLLRLGDEPLLPRNELALLGDHNAANALAASLAAAAVGVSPQAIGAGLKTARALAHRMEPIREVNGVLWINDSKATNIASTEVALEAMARPFVLLLGGRHKGEPYTRLRDRLRDHARAVIAYGEAQPIVLADLAGAVPLHPASGFDDAVAAARRIARSGDVVLLSPACSSYDLFTNYEERGARFRAIVEAM
jgi:UDP-N-acetylmuramoylalanine--D-glutamate ligase